jgi:mono/diheme cytochrome c family protein
MMSSRRLAKWRFALIGAVICVIPASAASQDAATYFEENCMSCHTIGEGELNGPDLKGVTRQRDGAWLRRFIENPEAMVNARDPLALELLHRYEDALMPTPEGLTLQLLEDLILYIDRQSGGGGTAPFQVDEAPFTPEDVAAGEALFTGRAKLAGGGAACNACHGAGPIAWLGGARLGPDLTFVSTRMKGRVGVTAWLKAPPTPVMRRLFREQPLTPVELHALTAYLEDANTTKLPRDRRLSFTFLMSGFLGAILGLIVFDRTWKGRLSRRGHR